MPLFIESILYSYAQIFFSNRKWFGAVALASTFAVPEIGLMSLLGVVMSNLAAYLLQFDQIKIRNGFYGFNGILFGAASVFYFDISLQLLLLVPVFIIITFLIASVLENYMAVAFNLPGLSMPFIITLFIFLIFLSNYEGVTYRTIEFNDLGLGEMLPSYLNYYLHSMALIFFQPSAIAGVILAAGLLFFSRVLFVLSILALSLNYLFLNLIMPGYSDSLLLLSGFNSILTAFALGGSLIIPSRNSLLMVTFSLLLLIVLTGFFSRFLQPYNLPVLVLPFNFIVLSTLYSLKFRQEQSDLVLLYFEPGSPEENYYYHHYRKSRFGKFRLFMAELPFFGEWYVSQGREGNITHRGEWKEALDFVVVDSDKNQFNNSGNTLKDYYCYRLPVSAPLDGKVVRVADNIPNNDVGEVNLDFNWGNTVIIDHGQGLFSSLSHLEAGSIKVKPGDSVKKGDIIASCGNSGRSPYPHLHFQFQATDKLGDKTVKYPLSSFIEKKGDRHILRLFDFPGEKTQVQNLEIHRVIKDAFDFKLGDRLKFSCLLNGKSFLEEWEVKVDIYNNLYFESSRNSTAYFYQGGKVFFISNFIGNKNSALYYFYLLALQVPLSYRANLEWKDELPLSLVISSFTRYVSEFLLLFRQFIRAYAHYSYEDKQEEDEQDYVISSELKILGNSFLSGYRKEMKGRMRIDFQGFVKELSFKSDAVSFRADIIRESKQLKEKGNFTNKALNVPEPSR